MFALNLEKYAIKIAVTGMGVVSPLGNSVEAFWEALCAGRSGLAPLSRFDVSEFPYHVGGEVRAFALPADIAAQAAGYDLATQYMLGAAAQAITAGLAEAPAAETAVVVATNFGGTTAMEELIAWVHGAAGARDVGADACAFQRCADRIGDHWHFNGLRTVLSLSCSSGAAALAHGMELIRSGRAQRVLTGGYDMLSRFCWSGLGVLRTMTQDALRPFDKGRNGTLFSEGAGALLLENFDAARARGAPLLAEAAGAALNNNAYHMTAPAKEGRGSAEVMAAALDDAGCRPAEVDHFNAHGTGTKQNDATETQALKHVLGARARAIPVTSIKSMTGHMMGAAGSVEAIASILSLRHGIIPPTINYREPDPECDLDIVANKARAADIACVLSNSAGIGGCNAALVLKKVDPAA